MKTTRRNFLKYLGAMAGSLFAIPAFFNPKKVDKLPLFVDQSLPMKCDKRLTDTDGWYIVTDKGKPKEMYMSENLYGRHVKV